MNRLSSLLQKKDKNLLSVYFTAGYPEKDSTVAVMEALCKGGADMIEVGIPFSDPMADGPVIQNSGGIGGGGLFTAYFSYIHLPVKESIALSMSLVLPMSIATTFYVISGHSDVDYTFGLIYYPAFLSIVIPAVICAQLGVRLRSYIPYKILQKILACMLLASGIYLVYKTVS